MCREKRPVIGGCAEVGGGESVSSVCLALVIVEGAAVVAFNGPGVGRHRALVVGDQIAHCASALLRRELRVLRRYSDSSHSTSLHKHRERETAIGRKARQRREGDETWVGLLLAHSLCLNFWVWFMDLECWILSTGPPLHAHQ